jgi:CRISPR-associated endonuclease/helicase Cas3
MQYAEWFETSTGLKPHAWQNAFAASGVCRSQTLRIPTGYGKTLGSITTWLFHRVIRGDGAWPARLVYCLPMRVLVEQTESSLRTLLESQGLLWDGASSHEGKVGVHVLMGGVDAGGEWSLHPEQPAVLIGTQDMLLSRALNRGYASGRARWPLEFGLLGHDSLWVFDEIQLMDVGLATSAQLQTYLEEDEEHELGLGTTAERRPRRSWWMSATLQPDWLSTVDSAARQPAWSADPCTLSAAEFESGLGSITKSLSTCVVPLPESSKRGAPLDERAFAARILEEQQSLGDNESGSLTLVVVNTVDRALATYRCLRELAPELSPMLLHSRFRGLERRHWREQLLDRKAQGMQGAGGPQGKRLIVATQVIEAGVDLSADLLITELAPWPSLVQRFGRCARFGGTGRVLVVDREAREQGCLPYSESQLDAARTAISELSEGAADVGIASLEQFESGLSGEQRAELYPYEPEHLLLRREYEELFDTTPDLSGADLDISRFIRSGTERDVSIFWRDFSSLPKEEQRPGRDLLVRREELCSVPFLSAQSWLFPKGTSLAKGKSAWVWDYLDRAWRRLEKKDIRPGQRICISSASGGYDPDLGFDPSSTAEVPLPPQAEEPDSATAHALAADSAEDAEDLSLAEWKTIGFHGREVEDELASILPGLGLPEQAERVLRLAARWHDYGKSHPAFQGSIRDEERPERTDLAKAPARAWPIPRQMYRYADDSERRPGFRHELASALALFAMLERHDPMHEALLGPWSEALALLQDADQAAPPPQAPESLAPPTPIESEVLACTAHEFDLLVFLVASHHGKVRVALHASPKDQEYRDRDGRGFPLRGIREGDELPATAMSDELRVPALQLSLAPASIGLSSRSGRSWRERVETLRARFGPARLAWLEALLIAADRRASRSKIADPSIPIHEGASR